MSDIPELPANPGRPAAQQSTAAAPLAPPAQLGVRLRWLWLFLALAAAALYPAFTQNIAALAYDAALEHVPRGLLFSQAIDDGALYPRWVQFLHLGLGSPLFTFQGPLPYYGLDLLYRLGLPHPIGWRLLIGGGLLAAAAGAYLFVRLLTGQRWPAMLAAMAYLYAPYVLRNALERGSNEAFSVFLYPWVLWALLWLARRPSAGRFLVASLLWAGCIGAHVLGPLMLAPVAALVGALAAWRYRTVAPLGALFAGGLLMAAVWAPMVPEQQWVHVERDFSQPEAIPLQNPIPVDRLLSPPSPYDAARDANGSGDRVGLLQTVLLVLGIPAALYAWRRGRRDLAVTLGIATALGLLLFWMFTGASDFVWRLAGPLLAGLLYRTRLMGLQALAVACAGGCALALFPLRWQRTLGLGVALLLILAALPSLYVGLQHNYAYFEDTLSLAQVRATELKVGGRALTAFGEFAPVWRSRPLDQTLLDEVGRDQDPQVRPLADPSPGVTVEDVRVRSSAWDLAVQADQPVTLTLYLFYYPRWEATVDGRPVGLQPQAETGYAQLAVPAGQHQVALRYGGTPVESAGLAISGLTLLGLLSAWGVSLARRVRPAAEGRRSGGAEGRVGEWGRKPRPYGPRFLVAGFPLPPRSHFVWAGFPRPPRTHRPRRLSGCCWRSAGCWRSSSSMSIRPRPGCAACLLPSVSAAPRRRPACRLRGACDCAATACCRPRCREMANCASTCTGRTTNRAGPRWALSSTCETASRTGQPTRAPAATFGCRPITMVPAAFSPPTTWPGVSISTSIAFRCLRTCRWASISWRWAWQTWAAANRWSPCQTAWCSRCVFSGARSCCLRCG